jgi:hypothetical protein
MCTHCDAQGETGKHALSIKQWVKSMEADTYGWKPGRSKAEKRLAESERALAEASLDARRLARPDAD